MQALIVLLPLLSAVIVGLNSSRLSEKASQIITCSLIGITAILSIITFYQVAIEGQVVMIQLFEWFDSAELKTYWSVKVDVLTAVMLIVVTVVSFLVHLYSVGYMHHDPHVPRFMSYLSLFTFFMLMLVTADDFIQLFMGWEGVGLSSYLLIGFWYKKNTANAAAIKAFLVNRVGDFGLALGIFTIYVVFGTLNYEEVFSRAHEFKTHYSTFLGYSVHTLTLICILLFIGCMGKSAQLGLHTWLPDAMEGPTPVSALIHAATMVTAGVFLVARASPLFEYAPTALMMVTIVGAATAVFAGTIALTQNDIKKVIAYSTCSQLGYMFFACGVSAYSAAIFHLMTHAFFKALLFLSAGSVIHAMSNEQDIQKMGGIWKKIPVTYAMFWIGSLALAGFPPFAGFYSKDIILESAYASHAHFGKLAYFLGLFAAFLTAFYSWRLLILTFHGKPRASKKTMDHVHESPPVILIPLIVLAVGAVFSGLVGYYLLKMVDVDLAFWARSIFVLDENNPLEHAHHVSGLAKYAPLIAGLSGVLLAYLIYQFKQGVASKIAAIFKPVYKFLLNKWYFDELYEVVFIRPAKVIGTTFWKFFDIVIIDGFGPNGFASASKRLAGYFSRFQTGYIYNYAFVMILGLLAIITWFLFNIPASLSWQNLKDLGM